MQRWVFLPPVKVGTTLPSSPSPSGGYSAEQDHIRPQRLGQADRLNQLLSRLMSSAATGHCCIMCRFCCLSLFLSASLLSSRSQIKRELKLGGREMHTTWKQRRVCSPCCGGTFALSERSRRRKETVVLMLLEQLPTRMTKLRLKPFSPRLHSHECWEIVYSLRR